MLTPSSAAISRWVTPISLRASASWVPRARASILRAPDSISAAGTPAACSSRSSSSQSRGSRLGTSLISIRCVLDIEPLGDRHVLSVPALPVACLVAAEEQQGRASRVERKDDPDLRMSSGTRAQLLQVMDLGPFEAFDQWPVQ